MRALLKYHTEVNFNVTFPSIPKESAKLSKQYANHETAGIHALIKQIKAARLSAESTVPRHSEKEFNSDLLFHLAVAVQWSHELRKFLTVSGLSSDVVNEEISAAIKEGLKEIGKLVKLLCTADLMLPNQMQAANAAYSLVHDFSTIAENSYSWMSKEARVARRVAQVFIAQARYKETWVNQLAEARKRWKKEILVPYEEDELKELLRRRPPSHVSGLRTGIVKHLDGKSPANWTTSLSSLTPKH